MLKTIYAPLLIATLAVSGCVDEGGGNSGPRSGSAMPGDMVLNVTHTEVMPNILGGEDVFGRTRDTGKTMVILDSAANGKAVFRRQDVAILSSKNTGNISPTVINTGKKASDVIVLPSMAPKDEIGPMRETSFTLTAAPGNNAITIDGHTLTVLSVQNGIINYSAN
ncbi:MAG: hypothetical protein R3D61_12570 [Defluviimonas denitrificans]|jgi:hypothetical protein